MALGRWTSRVLQSLGLAGLLACLALAVVILLGRAWIGAAVGEAFTTVDITIVDGLTSIDDAATRLTEATTALDGLLAELGPLPASSPVPAAVAARVSQVVDAHAPARDRYVEARSTARAALDLLELSGRVTPGAGIPNGVSDALTATDARLASIDTALIGLRGASRGTAGDLAAAATTLRDAITSAVKAAGTLRTEAGGLRARITDAHAGLDRTLWQATLALLVVVGYVALLNLIIIRIARRRANIADVGVEIGPAADGAMRDS